MFIRPYDAHDNPEQDVMLDSPFGGSRFTDIIEVEGPLDTKDKDISEFDINESKTKRARNLVVGNDEGKLFIYGTPPHLKKDFECEVLNSHHGQINVLRRSWDSRIVVSVG